MKVGELIEILKKIDPEIHILVASDRSCEDLSEARDLQIQQNVQANYGHERPGVTYPKAIVIDGS